MQHCETVHPGPSGLHFSLHVLLQLRTSPSLCEMDVTGIILDPTLLDLPPLPRPIPYHRVRPAPPDYPPRGHRCHRPFPVLLSRRLL